MSDFKAICRFRALVVIALLVVGSVPYMLPSATSTPNRSGTATSPMDGWARRKLSRLRPRIAMFCPTGNSSWQAEPLSRAGHVQYLPVGTKRTCG